MYWPIGRQVTKTLTHSDISPCMSWWWMNNILHFSSYLHRQEQHHPSLQPCNAGSLCDSPFGNWSGYNTENEQFKCLIKGHYLNDTPVMQGTQRGYSIMLTKHNQTSETTAKRCDYKYLHTLCGRCIQLLNRRQNRFPLQVENLQTGHRQGDHMILLYNVRMKENMTKYTAEAQIAAM